MEATFSLSRHLFTHPDPLSPNHRKPPVLGSYRQPSPPTFALRPWPNPFKPHPMTWAVEALPNQKVNGYGVRPSRPTGKVHSKAWAVHSFPTPKGNGGDSTRAWATAFAEIAVAACVVGVGMSMRRMMVAPPAIAAFAPLEPRLELTSKDVVASDELRKFLQVCRTLPRPEKEEIGNAGQAVSRELDSSRTDYIILKENARVVIASGEAEDMMNKLRKFYEHVTSDGERALEIGLIYLEMLILQGKAKDALAFLNSDYFRNLIGKKKSERDGRPFLYEAAACLLLQKKRRAIKAWNKFAIAENKRRDMHECVEPKVSFEALQESMTRLKRPTLFRRVVRWIRSLV